MSFDLGAEGSLLKAVGLYPRQYITNTRNMLDPNRSNVYHFTAETLLNEGRRNGYTSATWNGITPSGPSSPLFTTVANNGTITFREEDFNGKPCLKVERGGAVLPELSGPVVNPGSNGMTLIAVVSGFPRFIQSFDFGLNPNTLRWAGSIGPLSVDINSRGYPQGNIVALRFRNRGSTIDSLTNLGAVGGAGGGENLSPALGPGSWVNPLVIRPYYNNVGIGDTTFLLSEFLLFNNAFINTTALRQVFRMFARKYSLPS